MRKSILVLFLFVSLNLAAQEKHKIESQDYQNTTIEMADAFRQDGKIWVVVAVAGIILSGLIFYAVVLDRKISRVEKEFGTKDVSKSSYK